MISVRREPVLADRGLITEGTVASWAVFSPDRRYRYILARVWHTDYLTSSWKQTDVPLAVYVMHNPSKADAVQADMTVTRCTNFAQRYGCGAELIVNLFALRATNPRDLLLCQDPVGACTPAVFEWVFNLGVLCMFIAAWGDVKQKLRRRAEPTMIKILANDAWCFGRTQSGEPRHPSRLLNDTVLRNTRTGQRYAEPINRVGEVLTLPW